MIIAGVKMKSCLRLNMVIEPQSNPHKGHETPALAPIFFQLSHRPKCGMTKDSPVETGSSIIQGYPDSFV